MGDLLVRTIAEQSSGVPVHGMHELKVRLQMEPSWLVDAQGTKKFLYLVGISCDIYHIQFINKDSYK